MQGDLRLLDPIWTTANITAYHGAMIYDTLFALDGEQRTQPQMVSKYDISADKAHALVRTSRWLEVA